MVLEEITPVATVILVSGVISILTLIVSKISNIFKTKIPQNDSGSYECGFIRKKSDFSYSSENTTAISIFLILELITIWLLFCCFLNIITLSCNENGFIRYLTVILLISIIFTYKIVFQKEKNNA